MYHSEPITFCADSAKPAASSDNHDNRSYNFAEMYWPQLLVFTCSKFDNWINTWNTTNNHDSHDNKNAEHCTCCIGNKPWEYMYSLWNWYKIKLGFKVLVSWKSPTNTQKSEHSLSLSNLLGQKEQIFYLWVCPEPCTAEYHTEKLGYQVLACIYIYKWNISI